MSIVICLLVCIFIGSYSLHEGKVGLGILQTPRGRRCHSSAMERVSLEGKTGICLLEDISIHAVTMGGRQSLWEVGSHYGR